MWRPAETRTVRPPGTPTVEEAEAPADIELFGGEIEGSDEYGFAFSGDSVGSPGPTVTVPAGEEVTIRFENVSDNTNHNLVVAKDRHGTSFVFEPLWDAETSTLTPGRSETISFTPDAAGTYAYVCTIFGHAGNGMYGEIVVSDP